MRERPTRTESGRREGGRAAVAFAAEGGREREEGKAIAANDGGRPRRERRGGGGSLGGGDLLSSNPCQPNQPARISSKIWYRILHRFLGEVSSISWFSSVDVGHAEDMTMKDFRGK